MARPAHLEKILKLLVLSGTGNPSVAEREVAREKAELLMRRHGVTRAEMRELYRLDHGLPPRGPREPPAPDPAEQERLRRAALARDEAARAEATRQRLARAQAERERAAREREEQARLSAKLRAALSRGLGLHPDFADFIDYLAGLGVQMALPAEGALERMIYRWPPSKVAIPAASLGPGYAWPELLRAGVRLDPRDLRHRETLAMMFMG